MIWKRRYYLIVVLWVSWLFVVILSGANINLLSVDWNFGNTGTFGDSFGPLSAIMATVAALSALSTLREQRLQITNQYQRDAEQRLATQNAQLEQTFFNLVGLFRGLVGSIDIRREGKSDLVGQDAFHFFANRINGYTKTRDQSTAFRTVYREYTNDLAHYYRTLYNIILFIDKWSNDEKYFYVKLVRAMLSEAELLLIALNCAYGQGAVKFKPLVERYTLLNNLSEEARVAYNLDDYFEETAFNRPS